MLSLVYHSGFCIYRVQYDEYERLLEYNVDLQQRLIKSIRRRSAGLFRYPSQESSVVAKERKNCLYAGALSMKTLLQKNDV